MYEYKDRLCGECKHCVSPTLRYGYGLDKFGCIIHGLTVVNHYRCDIGGHEVDPFSKRCMYFEPIGDEQEMKPEFCAQCDHHKYPQYSKYGACDHPNFTCMRDFAWWEFENEMWTDSDTQFPNWCPLKDVEGDEQEMKTCRECEWFTKLKPNGIGILGVCHNPKNAGTADYGHMFGVNPCENFEQRKPRAERCEVCRYFDTSKKCDPTAEGMCRFFNGDVFDVNRSCCEFRPRTCENCKHSADSPTGVYCDLDGHFMPSDTPACEHYVPKKNAQDIDGESGDFEKALVEYIDNLKAELVKKNRKYGDAYRAANEACKEKYGADGIPFFVHTFEKQRRSDNQGDDDEDATFDDIGYRILEAVRKKFEKS